MARQPKQPRKRRASKAAPKGGMGELHSSTVVRTGLIRGATFGIKAVQYAIVDGLAIFEGDIALGTEEEMQSQTAQLRAAATGAVAMGVVRTGTQFRWPNCTIPYDIDTALTNRNRVLDAISHWQTNTHYTFVERTPANGAQYPDWVTFRPSSGCSSSVGRQGNQQFVNLGSGCAVGNVIHEIGHVVGLWHEQSREDRDAFVTIHWDKIQSGLEHNFNQHITDGDDVGGYDYGSIMHYPRDAFSIDGTDTITPVNASAQIGQRNALSAGDVGAANSLCPTLPKPAGKDGIFDTLKELTKDLRLDTRKERLSDTLKELIKDRIKDVSKDAIKDVRLDPPFRKGAADLIGRVRPGLGWAIGPRPLPGAIPFAVATPHQAPLAELSDAAIAQSATELDQQLATLAEAIADAEVAREALQQQYDETASLLQQALEASEARGGGPS